jgi:hypothetical protein
VAGGLECGLHVDEEGMVEFAEDLPFVEDGFDVIFLDDSESYRTYLRLDIYFIA